MIKIQNPIPLNKTLNLTAIERDADASQFVAHWIPEWYICFVPNRMDANKKQAH